MAANQTVSKAAPRATDEIVQDVLEMMGKGHLAPRALPDWIVAAGVENPYQLQEVRKELKAALCEGGTHFALTQSGRWLRTTERWAEGIGVEKGRTELTFRSKVPEVESVRAHVAAALVPANVKDAANTALDVFNAKANKKLDKASLEIAAEQVYTLVGRCEDAERSRAQAELYAEDTRQTRDKLLSILDRLSAKLGADEAGTSSKIAAE